MKAETKPNGRKAKGNHHQVLIVDDEAPVRELLRAFLSRQGYRTLVACDSMEALDTIRYDDVDLIISDYSMPGLNGIELHHRLMEVNPELAEKFVLITGTSFTQEVVNFVGEERVAFFEKPFRLPDLANCLQEILDRPPASNRVLMDHEL